MALSAVYGTIFKLSPTRQGKTQFHVKHEAIKTDKIVSIPKPSVKEVVAKVRMLESSGGVHDKCVRKGKGVNGYGFGQSLTKDNCYKSVKHVEKDVTAWFERNLKTMDVATALCYYNLGKPNGKLLSDCEYYQNYLKL